MCYIKWCPNGLTISKTVILEQKVLWIKKMRQI